jgi:hypothetical protein
MAGLTIMNYTPGSGRSGKRLMALWRKYLEQYADREGDFEAQAIVGAYHAVEVFTAFSRILDRDNRYKALIDERISLFFEATRQTGFFADCLINATFSIYNSLNTLGHQFTEGNVEAVTLIRTIDDHVHSDTESGNPIGRSAAALRASFPLLSLIAIALDQQQAMTPAIRQIEHRFAAGAHAASSDWEHLLNALYRMVEIVQLMALLTDPDLKDQINQIASRFQEEDQSKELPLKMRNGFCRLFELGHLMTTHVDAMV